MTKKQVLDYMMKHFKQDFNMDKAVTDAFNKYKNEIINEILEYSTDTEYFSNNNHSFKLPKDSEWHFNYELSEEYDDLISEYVEEIITRCITNMKY